MQPFLQALFRRFVERCSQLLLLLLHAGALALLLLLRLLLCCCCPFSIKRDLHFIALRFASGNNKINKRQQQQQRIVAVVVVVALWCPLTVGQLLSFPRLKFGACSWCWAQVEAAAAEPELCLSLRLRLSLSGCSVIFGGLSVNWNIRAVVSVINVSCKMHSEKYSSAN